MIDIKHFKEFITNPVLSKLQSYSSSMEKLLIVTAYDQTEIGERLNTKTGLGLYGMSLQSHHEIWNNYLVHDTRFLNILMMNFNVNPCHDLYYRLTYDIWYSTAMCYFHYKRKSKEYDTVMLERADPKDLVDIYNDVYADKALTKDGRKHLVGKVKHFWSPTPE